MVNGKPNDYRLFESRETKNMNDIVEEMLRAMARHSNKDYFMFMVVATGEIIKLNRMIDDLIEKHDSEIEEAECRGYNEAMSSRKKKKRK